MSRLFNFAKSDLLVGFLSVDVFLVSPFSWFFQGNRKWICLNAETHGPLKTTAEVGSNLLWL
jgi:hypothetical protein